MYQQDHRPRLLGLKKHIIKNSANWNKEKPLYTRRYHTQSSRRALREGRINCVATFSCRASPLFFRSPFSHCALNN